MIRKERQSMMWSGVVKEFCGKALIMFESEYERAGFKIPKWLNLMFWFQISSIWF